MRERRHELRARHRRPAGDAATDPPAGILTPNWPDEVRTRSAGASSATSRRRPHPGAEPLAALRRPEPAVRRTPAWCSSCPYFVGQDQPPYARATSGPEVHPAPDIEKSARPPATARSSRWPATSASATTSRPARSSCAWDLSTDSHGRRRVRPRRRPHLGTVYLDDDEAIASGTRPIGLPMRAHPAPQGHGRQLLGHGHPRARAGRARRSTTTAGPSYGVEGGPEVDEDRYMEFWNLVFMQDERGRRGAGKTTSRSSASCRRRTSTPAWAWSASPRCCRAWTTSTRSTRLRPVLDRAAALAGKTYGANSGTRRTSRTPTTSGCGSSPTTSAPRRCSSATAWCPATRAAATCCADCCAARPRDPAAGLSRSRRCPSCSPAASRLHGAVLPGTRDATSSGSRPYAYAEEEAFRATLRCGHDDPRRRRRRDATTAGARRCRATRRSRCTTPTASRST